jgi:hypothetical protein
MQKRTGTYNAAAGQNIAPRERQRMQPLHAGSILLAVMAGTRSAARVGRSAPGEKATVADPSQTSASAAATNATYPPFRRSTASVMATEDYSLRPLFVRDTSQKQKIPAATVWLSWRAGPSGIMKHNGDCRQPPILSRPLCGIPYTGFRLLLGTESAVDGGASQDKPAIHQGCGHRRPLLASE